ncbi:MAG: hypothetical protein CMC70_10595 [Flavobacteriaceae bacterium]|nr:hypothetical protein [Flavobacteriaceae bacterium]
MGQFYDSWVASRGGGASLPPGARTRDPEAVDMYQTLVRTIGRYRTAAGARLSRQEIQMLEAQVDIARLNSDMIENLHGVDADNADSVRDAMVRYLNNIRDNRTELATQRRQFNDRLMSHVDDEHRRGANPDAAAWTALSGGLFDGPETTAADVELPQLLLAMRDRGYGGVSFDYEPGVGFSNISIAYTGSLRTNIERLFQRAEFVERGQESAESSLTAHLSSAEAVVNSPDWATLTDEQKVEQLRDSMSHVQGITDDVAAADGVTSFQTSTETLNTLQQEDDYLSAADEDLDRLRAELFGSSAGDQDVIGRGIQALVDSGWAESNGFNLGSYIDTNGDGNPDTYVEGPDDRRAMLSWRRQMRRGPGRGYGVRGSSSGMWVELQVALSEDQVEQYRSADGFAYRDVNGEQVWMTPGEYEREVSAAPVRVHYINEGTDSEAEYFESSDGRFFIKAPDGNYFIEESLDPERHALIRSQVSEYYAANPNLGPSILAGTSELSESGRPAGFAYDEDLVTEPGGQTTAAFNEAGGVDTRGSGSREEFDTLSAMSRDKRRQLLGIEFADFEEFRANKSHRVVGMLDRQHAYDDLTYGVGTVSVNGVAYAPDEIVQEVRIISRKSETRPRDIFRQIRANGIADEIGYGTSGQPSPPRTFNRGLTVFSDESEIRDNTFDRIATEVGNLPERPSVANMRAQTALATAEGIQTIESNLVSAQSVLEERTAALAEHDATIARLTSEQEGMPGSAGIARDFRSQRRELERQRRGAVNDVRDLEQSLRRANRRFGRQATADVEEQVARADAARDREARRSSSLEGQVEAIVSRAQAGVTPTPAERELLEQYDRDTPDPAIPELDTFTGTREKADGTSVPVEYTLETDGAITYVDPDTGAPGRVERGTPTHEAILAERGIQPVEGVAPLPEALEAQADLDPDPDPRPSTDVDGPAEIPVDRDTIERPSPEDEIERLEASTDEIRERLSAGTRAATQEEVRTLLDNTVRLRQLRASISTDEVDLEAPDDEVEIPSGEPIVPEILERKSAYLDKSELERARELSDVLSSLEPTPGYTPRATGSTREYSGRPFLPPPDTAPAEEDRQPDLPADRGQPVPTPTGTVSDMLTDPDSSVDEVRAALEVARQMSDTRTGLEVPEEESSEESSPRAGLLSGLRQRRMERAQRGSNVDVPTGRGL